ncbi:hypothetical protein SPLC1_S540830 [Arthrospira platensis C1]|uniref:Uncharacterized protein n=1 Tax=Limnospira maxima CS-328 TaxID=513049 RepID=B5W0P3_LIMMA|nr:hypothetical protein AmaxDRAFT_2337 [Limnospira maxima CS-328]EKD06138.1 hypothetical protein SPLC1_S540830 [Arthrospira platensis C1]
MKRIFGEFLEAPSTSNEFLVIGLSPTSVETKVDKLWSI